MKVCLVYDDQEDYNIDNNIEYADFCLDSEAQLIINSLQKSNHEVSIIKGKKSFLEKINEIKKSDLVFNKTEGFNSRNREGLMPGVLEYLNVPYSGTDAYGFSLSLNKFHTKLIAKYLDIPTPDFRVVDKLSEVERIRELHFPIIIKPNNEGSSMGCSVHHEYDDNLKVSIKKLLEKFNEPVIVEEYISGIDISVPILGNGDDAYCLGVVYFSNSDGTYPEIASTEFKYLEDYKTEMFTCEPNVLNMIQNISLQIYNALGCKDYARVDIRVHDDQLYFLEINPLPTLCENGAFDICAKNIGKTMQYVIDEIISNAIIRSTNK